MLELYAMDMLSPLEKEQVGQWINQHQEVATELQAIETSLQKFASLADKNPGETVKQGIFEKLSLQLPANPMGKVAKVVAIESSHKWKWIAAASALLLTGSLAFNYIFYNKYHHTLNEFAVFEKSKDTLSREINIMKDPNSIAVSLQGLNNHPGTKAKIFWIKETEEVYIDASNLPALPEGKQYQFWGIVDNVPVSGGMIIKYANEKIHLQRMKSFGKAEAFAISIEKTGGSSTPTDIVSLGKII
jgi:anti-sigma-K factor RskA